LDLVKISFIQRRLKYYKWFDRHKPLKFYKVQYI
jgi:hypothetical protein